MTIADAELERIAHLIAGVVDRPRDRMRVLFAVTLRGFDYDTAIAAMDYGLRVGILRAEGPRLVAADPPPRSEHP